MATRLPTHYSTQAAGAARRNRPRRTFRPAWKASRPLLVGERAGFSTEDGRLFHICSDVFVNREDEYAICDCTISVYL